jgi:hypothetical protein
MRRSLAVLLREHYLKESLLKNSKLGQHAHEEAGIKTGFWKLKVTAGIGTNPMSHPSFDVHLSADVRDSSWVSIRV